MIASSLKFKYLEIVLIDSISEFSIIEKSRGFEKNFIKEPSRNFEILELEL